MKPGKKLYFASDFHLGAPDRESSALRERKLVQWLDSIKADAEGIYLVGDVFDFWFEYKTVIPRGHVRLLGKLAELSDAGIDIHWFTGNHDMWIFDYIPNELGIQLHRQPIRRNFEGKEFLIGHGDGLGPGDHGYKVIKRVFANPVCQFLFRWIHPDLGIRLARFWSGTSRTATTEERFLGADKEFLMVFANDYLKKEQVDYFIFGHRHLPLDLPLEPASRYINLGEWFNAPHYAVFDGNELLFLKHS